MSKFLSLKKRKEFLRVASKGFKMVTSSIILQATLSLSVEEVPCKIGLTTSKKIGSAVVRNRARRRLRAVIRENRSLLLNNVEYVFIGRHNTADCDYIRLQADFIHGVNKINHLIKEKRHEKTSDSLR